MNTMEEKILEKIEVVSKLLDEARQIQAIIFRAISENGQISADIASAHKDMFKELEEILPKKNFFRISNSEIINFDKVKKIDFKIYGNFVIHFYSGKTSYASRRYIKKIKEFLGL